MNKRQADGSVLRMADVEVGDETGTVLLRARDEQIDILREVSERSGSNNNSGCLAIVLENCMLQLFQGRYIRLAITKWGKMYPDAVASTPLPPRKMNTGRNYSLVDLSLIQNDSYSSCDLGETFQQLNITGGQQHQNGNYGHYTVGDQRRCLGGQGRGPGKGGRGRGRGSTKAGRGRGSGPPYGISRAEYVARKQNEKVQAQLQHILSSTSSTIPSYGVTSYI